MGMGSVSDDEKLLNGWCHGKISPVYPVVSELARRWGGPGVFFC
jgi:hypothetical protein